MKTTFRFFQTSDNNFVWTDDKRYKLTLSNPYIQPFEAYAPISEENKIMNMSYTMTVSKLDDNKWSEFARAHMYDFPSVPDLIECIKEITSVSAKANSQKQMFTSGMELSRYTVETEPHRAEDYYRIDRLCMSGSKEWYCLSVGSEDKMLRIDKLTVKDLNALNEWAAKFMEYACAVTDRETERQISRGRQSCYTSEGKLFKRELDTDKDQNIIQTGRNNGLYLSGEKISFRFLKNGKPYPEHDLLCTLVNIGENEITVSGKDYSLYENGSFEHTVEVTDILRLYQSFDKDTPRLYMTAEEIASEYAGLLSVTEIREFETLPAEQLLQKHSEVLKDRYIMFREEHSYWKEYKGSTSDDRLLFVNGICCRIVRIIKEQLQNNLLPLRLFQ